MKIVKDGVTAPKGFFASAVNCGVKRSGRNDLALLFSEKPALCAATFTTNKFKSGSVVLSEKRVKRGAAQAVIVNSGNANCCVGKKELKDATFIADSIARKLGLKKNLVLIASTGIIGRPLPVDKIKAELSSLVKTLNKKGATKFSKAIMTTDTVHKEISVAINIGGTSVKIGGAVKGSGMICPDMATMLAFFTTDVAIEKSALKLAFKECVSGSFNRITVDGDMSTNDTALIFANGLAGNGPIKKNTQTYSKFLNALKFASEELAKKIVLDGEGATKFVEVKVKGAKDKKSAKKVARHVAGSNLIKTMIAGGDPNWGRVAASIGSSGAELKGDRVNVYFGNILVMKNGAGTNASRKKLLNLFKRKHIEITINLRSGVAKAKVWTCDLTEDYVKINAEYET